MRILLTQLATARIEQQFGMGVRVMVFNAIFNNTTVKSWRSVLLVEETGESHYPVAINWQTLSYNVVSRTACMSGIQIYNVSVDRH
jgi:hypothetical protein